MKRRGREETERAFIDAVDAIIERDGLGAVGVNAIAREAGANKALIYRYFGGLDGLFREYTDHKKLWPGVDELVGDDPAALIGQPPGQVLAAMMENYARALSARPRTVELLAWEGVERNELTIALEQVRERRTFEVIGYLEAMGVKLDARGRTLFVLLGGAINYFVVKSRDVRFFGGVDIQREDFFEQLVGAVAGSFDG